MAPILTIAIPTFNRSVLLDLCLSHICGQLKPGQKDVELIVSDNHSPDDTERIVNKYYVMGHDIKYVRNASNIGPDGNICQCFNLASGKYVLIFSDDDILLDGVIDKLLHIVSECDYGVINLASYSYRKDHIEEMPKRKVFFKYIVYSDTGAFIDRVNCMLTFVSANIINKSAVDKNIDFRKYLDTNLVQTLWTFSALINSQHNMCVDELMVAAKQGNTGGYALAKVFAVNQNEIFRVFKGADPKWFQKYNSRILQNFLPFFIYSARKAKDKNTFFKEDHFAVLRPAFGGYSNFWFFTVPVIALPLFAAKLWLVMGTFITRSARILGKMKIVALNIIACNISDTLTVGK